MIVPILFNIIVFLSTAIIMVVIALFKNKSHMRFLNNKIGCLISDRNRLRQINEYLWAKKDDTNDTFVKVKVKRKK